MMYIYLGFQTFFTSFQILNMNGRVKADLIHLTLVQQEQILVDIEIAQIVRRRRRRRRPRRYWVRSWLSADRRLQFGQYDTLLRELGSSQLLNTVPPCS